MLAKTRAKPKPGGLLMNAAGLLAPFTQTLRVSIWTKGVRTGNFVPVEFSAKPLGIDRYELR